MAVSRVLALLATCVLGQTSPETPPGAFTFERYHTTEEIERTFSALAEKHPTWFRTGSLGETVQGRSIPYLAVSNFGSEEKKAGMWIDGAIHGGELASAEPALGVAESLRRKIAAGEPPDLLDRVVFYLVPVINVDARRLCVGPPYTYQRRNLQPVDDDGDGTCDEDPYTDINGDGHAGRVEIPTGATTSRLSWESKDLDGDGTCGEDPLGGIDLNRNFPVVRQPGDVPATPIQPETRAIIRFWKDHPEIQLAISFHTSVNAYALPPVPIPDEDGPLFDSIVSIYRRAGGGKELRPASYGATRGITSEWFYVERKAIAITIEISRLPSTSTVLDVPEDEVDHPCHGRVRVRRMKYADSLITLLERDLPAIVGKHSAYLLEMAERLPLER